MLWLNTLQSLFRCLTPPALMFIPRCVWRWESSIFFPSEKYSLTLFLRNYSWLFFCLFVFYSFLYKTNTIFPAFTRMVSQNSTYIISTYKSPLLTCMFSLHLQKNLVGKQILEQEGRAWWYISPPLPRGTFQLSSVFLLIVDAHLWDQSTL